MSNVGNDRTEQILKRLEDNIREQYTKAYKEIVKKLKSYLKQFDDEDVLQHERLDQGLITMADYLDWRRRHILLNKQWEDMRDALALDLHHVNEMAYKIAREQMPEIFAINANHAAYEIERDYAVDTGVKIYNRQAAERLLAKQQRLLPAPSKRKALELWENPDVAWNEKLVQSAVLQGILQGESMDKVAKRLMGVTEMDYRAAIRNARTMTTSAQNAGREDMYRQIDENGTKLSIVWLSTLDNRTRHSHRHMHGEVKDGEYYSNGLRYPGDPEGDPAEVYNCRCQERAFIKGMEEVPLYSHKMGEMSFTEWLNAKSPPGEHQVTLTGVNVTGEYRNTTAAGKGEIKLDAGYSIKNHEEEIKIAQFLHDKIGGEIVLLKESEVERPDYLWRGKMWELKMPTTVKAVDSAVRKAMSQISENPGGIILNFNMASLDVEGIEQKIESRMRRGHGDIDVMILHNGNIAEVLRYKSKA